MKLTATLPWERTRDRNEWRGVSAELRRSFIVNELYVPHPDLVKVLSTIKTHYQVVRESGRGRALLILCPSGGGKSHLIELLKKLLPNEVRLEVTYQRVVSFSVPPKPSAASMAKALLKSIGYADWMKGDAMLTTSHAHGFLSDLGTWIAPSTIFRMFLSGAGLKAFWRWAIGFGTSLTNQGA